MPNLVSTLTVKLIDQLSGPSKKAAGGLGQIDSAIKRTEAAIKRGDLAGFTSRFSTQLARMGLGARDVDKVASAFDRFRASAGLSRNALDWTRQQSAQVRAWENQMVASLRRVRGEASGMRPGGMAVVGGTARTGALAIGRGIAPWVGGYAVARAAGRGVGEQATLERRMTRIAITGDASREEAERATATVRKLADEAAMSVDQVADGLETLVAQGRSLPDALAFLSSVTTTAQASGAAADDIAKSVDAISTHMKIGAAEMQGALDILVQAGKVGMFELKDMARFLPTLAPSAKALGLEGAKGLSELSAILQVVRKGSGTAEEAATRVANIFQKYNHRETVKNFSKLGFDLEAALARGRKEGKNLITVLEDAAWKAIKGDLSQINKLFTDREVQQGMLAILSQRGEWQKMAEEIRQNAPGSAVRDFNRVIGDGRAAIDRLSQSWSNFWQGAARVADSGGLTSFLDGFAKRLNTIAGSLDQLSTKEGRQKATDDFHKRHRQGLREAELREIDQNIRIRERAGYDEKDRVLRNLRMARLQKQMEIEANEGGLPEIDIRKEILADLDKQIEERKRQLPTGAKQDRDPILNRLIHERDRVTKAAATAPAAPASTPPVNPLDAPLVRPAPAGSSASAQTPDLAGSMADQTPAARAAGQDLGESFRDGLMNELHKAKGDVEAAIRRIIDTLTFSASPDVRATVPAPGVGMTGPGLNSTGGERGLFSDYGVSP